MFYASLAVLALALAMVVGLRRSRTGRVLIAIRENERAARAYGVNATRTQLAGFALSGFLAAAAGALYVHQQTGLSADPYLPQRSLELFTMVVIGGLGSLPGALLGATYVHSVDFFLPNEWQFLATRRGLVVPSLLADVRVDDAAAADEPPPEDVLLAAGELAEQAEGGDGGHHAGGTDDKAPAELRS